MFKVLFLCFSIYFFFLASFPAFSTTAADSQVNLSGSVEEFTLNLSGSIAPYASLVLTSENNPIASVVADADGNFSFSNISITEGFSRFCLDGIDIKKIGESYTCFTVPPAKANILMSDIFLAPIIGLQRDNIKEGQEAIISGYSLPNSNISIHLGTNVYPTKANNSGYFIFSTKIQKAGKYEIFAGSEYNNKKSLKPAKTLVLSAFSTMDREDKPSVFVLLSIFFICVLIFVIVIKFKWYKFINKSCFSHLFSLFPKVKTKDLHHAWFIGY